LDGHVARVVFRALHCRAIALSSFGDSLEAYGAGMGPHRKEITADIANYTDQKPIIQISEVVVGNQ
jgi:uncharacterized protein (TIGR02118 family)